MSGSISPGQRSGTDRVTELSRSCSDLNRSNSMRQPGSWVRRHDCNFFESLQVWQATSSMSCNFGPMRQDKG